MPPLLATRERSDRAFEKLYQRHVGDVYRYALVVMRNPSDAEDVTQTTFMNAYRAFARGERPRTPQNWLIAIAHNVCRQRFRQLQRRPNETPLDEDFAPGVVDDDEAPTAEDIRRALSHLAFNQRAALVMRELEGRSYAEIAEVLDVSTSAVETLIFRARRALREQLEGGLTCNEAEFAISRQLDGRLPRKEKGALRAHLRECEECARFARSQRAQRSAIRGLALIPVPSSLSSFFHHGSNAAVGAGAATAGAGLATKAALVGATAIVATGVGVTAARKAGVHPFASQAPKAAAAHKQTPTQQPELTAAGVAGQLTSPSNRRNANAAAAAANSSPNRATPTPPVRAHGRDNAPGQLKPKTKPEHPQHPATPGSHGNKPAIPPGQAKKATKVAPVHAEKKAGPGGSVLRPAKPKPQPQPTAKRHPQPAPPPQAKKKEPQADEPKRTKTTPTTTTTESDSAPLAEHPRRVR